MEVSPAAGLKATQRPLHPPVPSSKAGDAQKAPRRAAFNLASAQGWAAAASKEPRPLCLFQISDLIPAPRSPWQVPAPNCAEKRILGTAAPSFAALLSRCGKAVVLSCADRRPCLGSRTELRSPVGKMAPPTPATLVLTGRAPSTFGPGIMGFRPPPDPQGHPSGGALTAMTLRFAASLR